MNTFQTRNWPLAVAAGCTLFLACGPNEQAPSSGNAAEASSNAALGLRDAPAALPNLSQASANSDSAVSCPANKDLICHYPPGNRANMHTLCIAPAAWPAHRDHHGDTMGACGASADAGSADAGNPDAGSEDAGSADAGSDDAGSPDAGPTCAAVNEMCSVTANCCAGLSCFNDVCTVIIQ